MLLPIQMIWYLASLFYNETHYSRIGGEAPDGTDLTCDMSYIILEAHEDPNRHPDLVVLVTGYSAFFASLSPLYRQQIVDRILAES